MTVDCRLYHQLDSELGNSMDTARCLSIAHLFLPNRTPDVSGSLAFSSGSQMTLTHPQHWESIRLAESAKLSHSLALKCSGLGHVTQLWSVRNEVNLGGSFWERFLDPKSWARRR